MVSHSDQVCAWYTLFSIVACMTGARHLQLADSGPSRPAATRCRSFYQRLLRPWVHYVPFWRHRPQEALQVVDWALAHDEQAQAIAKAGQEAVRK